MNILKHKFVEGRVNWALSVSRGFGRYTAA